MDDNPVPELALSNVLNEIKEALKEQSIAFASLSATLQGLSLKANNDNRSSSSDKIFQDVPFEATNLRDKEGLREAAKSAQEQFGAFDIDDVYHSLIDPFARSRQEKVEYGKEAARLYGSGEYQSVREVFEEDFLYWTEDHFKILPSSVVSKIRNALIQEEAPIERRAGLRMSTALAKYVANVRDKASENVQEKRNLNPEDTRQCEGLNKNFQDIKHLRSSDRTTVFGQVRSALGNSRPGDVSRLFPYELKYSGGPTEPIQRRYKIFLNACHLCGINQDDKDVMFPLLQTTFLKGQALLHFMDVVYFEAESPSQTIHILESHFLDDRAKRVNDDIWMELTFDLVKSARASKNQDITYESVLNDLLTQISGLTDIRTWSGTWAEIMAKTIAAGKGVETFSPVTRNPPKGLQELDSALRASALEADRRAMRGCGNEKSYIVSNKLDQELSETAEELLKSFFLDQKLKRREEKDTDRRRFKGYGDGKPTQETFRTAPTRGKTRVPWNVCIICNRKGCHSSNHRRAGRKLYKIFAQAFLAGENPEAYEDESPDESNEEDADDADDADDVE